MGRKSKVTDQEIIDACNASTYMVEAAAAVGLHFNTFKIRAKRLGVYNPQPHQ